MAGQRKRLHPVSNPADESAADESVRPQKGIRPGAMFPAGEWLPGTVWIRSVGNRELYIENFQSILEYSDRIVRLQAKYDQLCIEGRQLQIRYYNREEMKICGRIHCIRFERCGRE